MKALFIANVQMAKNEGIYKKIVAQANGIKEAVGNCTLLTKNSQNTRILNLNENTEEECKGNVLDVAMKMIDDRMDYVYIRHMIPKFKLLKLLRKAKKRKTKVYYEIPTYPYFAEQYRMSNKKYRAICKIFLDIIFLPIIYQYIYKMVIIKSNTRVKKYKKMIEINNGAYIDNIKLKKFHENKEKFSMVTVGTLYPYHGYDRILMGLKQCNERIQGKTIEFNIIGKSQTIDELKKKVDELGLKNVKFLGVKNVDEMNELFDNYNVGLGCLALHRRNADIDTTIKIIEYYCRGITVVTSGISPMDSVNKNNTIVVKDSEEAIDIEHIYNKYIKIENEEKIKVAKKAKEIFSWQTIMKEMLNS